MTITAKTAAPKHPRARRLSISLSTLIGLVLLLVLIVMAIAAPLLAPHDPESIDAARVLAPPSLQHPFGSDVLGRDVLSRVIFGLRASLLVVSGAIGLAVAASLPLGLLAGYAGGAVDSVISRVLDMVLILPAMLLAVSFIAILGPGGTVAALAIAVVYLPILARVMRGSTRVVAGTDYVLAARARGASHWRIVIGHVMPNAIGPLVVQASILGAFALQLEAALSFLGLGTQPPTPSLGGMLADGRDVLVQAPWVEFFPGAVIAIAVLSLILIGDGLKRSLDPQGVAE